MSEMKLSDDQEAAVQAVFRALRRGPEAVLTGAAGTGKTTTLRAIVERWQAGEHREAGLGPVPTCVCPTWKAALRFTQVTGWEATSIHGLIYGRPLERNERGRTVLEFNDLAKDKGADRALIIVDEASMVGTKVYADITAFARMKRCKLLFVGDREQLEPVNEQWGVDFAHPTAALTKVHRQADGSNLLDFVTCVREGRLPEFTAYGSDVQSLKPIREEDIVSFWQRRPFTGDRILITYTNRLRVGQNNIARRALGFAGLPLQRGEALMSFANRGPLVNGEVILVTEAPSEVPSGHPAAYFAALLQRTGITLQRCSVGPSLGEPGAEVYLLPELLGKLPEARGDVWKDIGSLIKSETGGGASVQFGKLRVTAGSEVNPLVQAIEVVYKDLIDVDYGYACTAHKAQGSQWSDVAVLLEPALMKADGGVEFRRRWLYTAATRAEQNVLIGKIGG